MARIVNSADLNGNNIGDFTTDEQLWLYNGLDASVTHEIWSKIKPEMDDDAKRLYGFVRAMEGPALRMMLRGFKIDLELRGTLVQRLAERHNRIRTMFVRFIEEAFDWPDFNPNSTHQMKRLLYDVMKLPVQTKLDKVKKERVPSVDREALEKLEPYFYAGPIVRFALAIRDLKKKIEVLTTSIEDDGRMRCSYNVVGTKFGRWSSAANAFGSGTNLQNVTDEMREIFIPDDGWKLAYADLEQAESVCVAYLSNDANYKAAIQSGDLHTYVCRLIFPHLPWTGNMKLDKEIAKKPFYRMFDHRDIAKRGGHATNYYAKPHTVAHRLRLPRKMAEIFQNSYFSAFPGIRDWQAAVGRELGSSSTITSPLGRKIVFFDRTDAEETLRAAIASGPQSMCGDILNRGLYNVWQFELEQPKIIQILGQVHDAIVFQYRPQYEVPLLTKVIDLMTIPVPIKDQGLMTIKTEVLTGWNWRKRDAELNPYGILKWTPGERDKRDAPKATLSNRFLDRRVCSAYKPLVLT